MKKPVKLFLIAMSLMLPSLVVARDNLPDFTTLVKRNHEAVVNISVRQVLDETDLDLDEKHRELLRKYQEEQNRNPFESGVGSGFIISSDGYVLTNNHVVEGADEVIVRMHDRRQLIASVVGVDQRSDVALLKLDATDLPVVSIGSSRALEVGEWVLAIGSPFGFDFSVTAGIVSAKGRALPNESYVPFIQTDVAINPGNSGGPLFNLDGDVIGINSQIYSRTGSFMGLSFAIPIEMAMDVADQLRTDGRVSRGWLGVHIQQVTLALAESFGMARAHGALVSNIIPNGPADKSALKVGDIITHFNGQYVDMSTALPPMVGRVRANTDVPVRVIRDGKPLEISVGIGELPGEAELFAKRDTGQEPEGPNLFELEVEPLDEPTREALGIDTGGVLVTEVVEGGPADKAGIVPGDAILTVDNKTVDTPGEFAAVVEAVEDEKSVPVLVQRAQGRVFLALQLNEE
ncbi:MAG: Do family serine endopeptidase [Granulosicoccus sp.]|nr:Do family serine endopeptidase [Granulosicoccus sp.]